MQETLKTIAFFYFEPPALAVTQIVDFSSGIV